MPTPRFARFPYGRGVPMAAHPKFWGAQFAIAESRADARLFAEEGSRAIVDIDGPLSQRDCGWMCDSYDSIRERVSAALASNAKEVVLRISSPGGDFAGAIELSRELREMAASAKKRLVCFTDSQALSAGYILACAASRITITPTAFVGSIGVWAPIIDETMRDKAMGLNVVIVASGSRKTDSNPHVAVTEDAVTAMQSQVDAMASMFFDFVSECRGVSLDEIVALQGSQEFGDYAVKLRLADNVVNSWGAFLTSAMKEDTMGKSFEEAKSKAREGLAKVAEGDDEDAKAARALLAKMDGEDAKAEDDTEEEPKKKEEASAADDAEDKKAADDKEEAKAEDEQKAAAKHAKPRLVASTGPTELALVARVHALETERAEEKEATARAQALGGRPDFTPAVRAFLSKLPIADVLKACKDFPKGTTPAAASLNASTVTGTRGEHPADGAAQGNSDFVGVSSEDFIDQRMGLKAASNGGVVNSGRELTLGYMTPAEVEIAAKKLGVKGSL